MDGHRNRHDPRHQALLNVVSPSRGFEPWTPRVHQIRLDDEGRGTLPLYCDPASSEPFLGRARVAAEIDATLTWFSRALSQYTRTRVMRRNR